MKGVNKAIIVGNVGQDPECKVTSNGKAVASLSLATSESWKDKQTGQKQEKTEWHRVVFFDRLADVVRDYIKKGSKVYVEGKITTRKWKDLDGKDRYTTEIVAGELQMLDSRPQAPQSATPSKEAPQDTKFQFDDDIDF